MYFSIKERKACQMKNQKKSKQEKTKNIEKTILNDILCVGMKPSG